MTTFLRILPALAVAGVLLAGCATDAPTPGSPGGAADTTIDFSAPIAAPGDVIGQGTVIQVGDGPTEICLGPITEIFPPNCSGPEVTGWDWDTVDGEQTSGDVTFGTYAVTGTWDGTTLGAKSAIMLALYDPMQVVDPQLDESNPGDTDPAELAKIQKDFDKVDSPNVLGSAIINGYLFVDVLYDDGSLQAAVDAKYLPDAVAIRGALHDAG
jgi:hypothetical protein